MSKLFTNVKTQDTKRNVFDLSHEKKLSMNMGDLVPIFMEEVVPGDTFRVNTEMLMRLAPMIAPVMHRVNVYTHYFFVPSRLLFDKWEEFITGGKDGNSMPAFPRIRVDTTTAKLFQQGHLSDYFGIPIPPTVAFGQIFDVSALPFRAYQLIYNTYFRDETLTPEVDIQTSATMSAQQIVEICTLRRRSWEKDYFTSALPWAQRGGEVLLPTDVQYKPYSELYNAISGAQSLAGEMKATAYVPEGQGNITAASVLGDGVRIENISSTETTINDFRRAYRLQTWLEKNARAGYRYVEQILQHFNVKSSDARLQRPEYLGGGKAPVVISEVLSSVGTSTVPQGNMSGHGISVASANHFKKSFEEHGYIIGIMSVLPRTAYQQGLEKAWTKFDKFDYYWPTFANIGEQEVKKSELYMDFAELSDNGATFGYQSRYAEYKFKNSSVHGDFRDNLSFWHMGRIFSTPPNLNADFVKCDPTTRIFAVIDDQVHHLYVQIYNDVKAIRPMPMFGTPTL